MGAESVEKLLIIEIGRADSRTLGLSIRYHEERDESRTLRKTIASTEEGTFNTLFSKFSRSSGVPSSDEEALLAAHKEACSQELANLRQEGQGVFSKIRQLAQELLRIESKICGLQDQISACDSFSAPIRKIPQEVLCRIFWLCIPEKKKPRVDVAPLLLCRVSNYWRDVALSDPRLWNRIRLGVPWKVTLVVINHMKTHLSVYGERAQTSPLSLAFFPNWKATVETALHGKAFLLLKKYLPFCRDLYLSSNSKAWTKRYASLDPSVFNNLEFLYLNVSAEAYDPASEGFKTFENANRLRSVNLVLWHPGGIQKLFLPYAQLVEINFTIRVTRTADAPDVFPTWKGTLALCPNLRTTHVHFQHHLANPNTVLPMHHSGEIVTLPFLESLDIITDFPGALTALAGGFTLPSLKVLKLNAIHPFCLSDDDSTPLPVLIDGPLSFFTGLTALTLLRVCIPRHELQTLFESLVNLEQLELMCVAEDTKPRPSVNPIVENSNVLHLLTIHSVDDEKPLLPRLRDLTLYFDYDADLSPNDNLKQLVVTPLSRIQWVREHTARVRGAGTSAYPPRYFSPFRFHLCFSESGGIFDAAATNAMGIYKKHFNPIKKETFQREVEYYFTDSINPEYPL